MKNEKSIIKNDLMKNERGLSLTPLILNKFPLSQWEKGGLLDISGVRAFVEILLVIFALLPMPANALFLQSKDTSTAATVSQSTTAPSSSLPVQSFRLKYVNAKAVSETFSGVFGEGEGVSVNEKLNTIVARASAKNLDRLGKLLAKMDVPPLQVQVEAKIIELKTGSGDTSNASILGASWKYSKNTNDYVQFLSDVSSTAATSILGLYAQLMTGNVDAYLTALEKTIGYDLVASPMVTALNHEEANILIGSKYGYLTTFATPTGVMQNVNFLEVGTSLKFTPHINEDGFIIMEVAPSVSEGQISNGLPQENTTETKNKVLVKDGQSIVIGGLTKNYNSEVEIGIPILSAIPFIGSIFRRTQLVSEKRDIMVIITPHIVTPEFLTEMAEKTQTLDARRLKWEKEKANLIH
ncbi:MAG: secretin N-terminal domain-containing protein [Candidatus Margulisbacteria bacterium]|nr:secretin N-terminal domain-containing protein [Candidatus Margulisiibacteriota bacterium]